MTQNVDSIYYLTPLQHGMLYHWQRAPGSGLYVEQFSCVLDGELDEALFRAAWSEVVHRHDALKTLFIRLQEEKPMQVVRREVALPFTRLDWSHCGEAEQQVHWQALLAGDRRRGFEIAKAPLLRLHLVMLAPACHRLLWTYHHAILDGWSMPIVLGEVFELYAAMRAGEPLRLPKPAPYRQYVNWLREQDPQAALEFWRKHLQDFRRPLRFSPAVTPGPATPAAGARQLASIEATLPQSWREAVTRAARAGKLTLNTVCQGAWSLLLARYGNTRDLVYGTVVSGRPLELPGIERMVGLFINTLPLRVRLPEATALVDWLQQLQAANVEIEGHGYGGLSDILQCCPLPRQQNLFDALYVFENYPGQTGFDRLADRCGLKVRDLQAIEETNYALAMIVVPQEAAGGDDPVGLRLHLVYDTAVFSEAAARRLVAQYQQLLARMPGLERMWLGELALDPPAPAVVLPALPAPTLLAQLRAQAAAHPARIAWADAGSSFNYRQLANLVQAAMAEWQRQPVAPGDLVLIGAERGLWSLVVTMAALSCGLEAVLLEAGTSPAVVAELGIGTPVGWVDLEPAAPGMPDTVRRLPIPDLPDLSAMPPAAAVPSAETGACWQLIALGDGQWQAQRYLESALRGAGADFAASYPIRENIWVPVSGSPAANAQLFSSLNALGAGLGLADVGAGPDETFLERVARANGEWHHVPLSAARTRALSHVDLPAAITLRTDHLIIDAASLTLHGFEQLQRQCPGNRLVKEFRLPADALPHARCIYTGEWPPTRFLQDLGTPVPGTRLQVLDADLRRCGLDAWGRLAIAGHSIPAALAGAAAARLATEPPADPAAPLLLTPLAAWQSETGFGADWASLPPPVNSPALSTLEQQLRAVPGVAAAMLLEHLDLGEWHHSVCYVGTPDAEPALRALLADSPLPAPALLPLVRMPDRPALARGEYEIRKSTTCLAPRNAVEQQLQAIWEALLKQSPISIDADYFALGGQSLLATVMLYQINEQLGVQLDVETLLEHPTIAGLAAVIAAGSRAAAQPRDLAAEVALDPAITPPTPFDADPFQPRAVLLTGATGFLGVHLLAELLASTSADVVCLVRAADDVAGVERLVATLQKWELWQPEFAPRLRAVAGELDQPRLGLDERRFAALADLVDAIYHNGAQVNFVYPYSALKQVNVLATADLLRLACTGHTKPVHYVSTVGVLDRKRDFLGEERTIALHPNLVGGYEQSKWVAEQLVGIAADRGLPVAIYRPSRIVGHARTGRINTDDLFCRMIKGMVEFGEAPIDVGYDNMVPVDVAARVIVAASRQPGVYGRALHVVNAQWNSVNAVVEFITNEGFALRMRPYNAWLAGLEKHVQQYPDHPLAMLIPVLHKLNPMVDPTISRRMPIDSSNVTGLLGPAALPTEDVTHLLRTYFDFFYASGYLTRPNVDHR